MGLDWPCCTPTQYFNVSGKVDKPDNFEQHNSRTLSFTNIQVLHSNSDKYESFFKANSLDILILCPLHMGLHHAPKTLEIPVYVFNRPYFIYCLTSFSCSPSLCLCTAFETISSNTDEVFS